MEDFDPLLNYCDGCMLSPCGLTKEYCELAFLWGNETSASRDLCTATKNSLVEGACESNRNDI